MYPSTYVARRTLGMWHLQVGPIMYASTSRFFFSREAARRAAPDATPAFAFFALRSFAGRAATVVGKGGGTPPRARMNTGASATRTSFGRRGEAVAHGAADCVAGEVRSIDWTFVGPYGRRGSGRVTVVRKIATRLKRRFGLKLRHHRVVFRPVEVRVLVRHANASIGVLRSPV